MEYEFFKFWNILSNAYIIPLGTYIGFLFGQGKIRRGLVFTAIAIALAIVDGWVWYRSMELLPRLGQ